MNKSNALSNDLIEKDLKTTFIGKKIDILPSIHSTNSYLKEINTSKLKSGHVVIANEQTCGRGRMNKIFISKESGGIYLSILLKLDHKKIDIRLLTICAAVAVSTAIKNICMINIGIKWVNDLYYAGKKMCGILTESVLPSSLNDLCTIVVGIGINTSTVPDEINDIAISIEEITGDMYIRNELICEVLNQFEKVYLDYTIHNKKSEIIEAYQKQLFIIDRDIVVFENNSSYKATVIGIDKNGALIVMDEQKQVHLISTGEIKLIL